MDRSIVNALVQYISKEEQKLVRKEHVDIDGNEKLSAMGIDSLEFMILFMWLGDIFGISQESFKEIEAEGDVTIDQLIDFIIGQATKTPTLESAVAEYDGG